MKMNYTAEWLSSLDHDCDEPAGYVSIGDRKILDQRRTEAETQSAFTQKAAVMKAEATATNRAEATKVAYHKAR